MTTPDEARAEAERRWPEWGITSPLAGEHKGWMQCAAWLLPQHRADLERCAEIAGKWEYQAGDAIRREFGLTADAAAPEKCRYCGGWGDGCDKCNGSGLTVIAAESIDLAEHVQHMKDVVGPEITEREKEDTRAAAALRLGLPSDWYPRSWPRAKTEAPADDGVERAFRLWWDKDPLDENKPWDRYRFTFEAGYRAAISTMQQKEGNAPGADIAELVKRLRAAAEAMWEVHACPKRITLEWQAADALERAYARPAGPWRVGRKVPINVYDGDRPVAQFQTPEDAARAVAAVNARPAEQGLDAATLEKCCRWLAANLNTGTARDMHSALLPQTKGGE